MKNADVLIKELREQCRYNFEMFYDEREENKLLRRRIEELEKSEVSKYDSR